MADTPLVLFAKTGKTLTLELYPKGSDTIANTGGDAFTESTNRKGRYRATVSEALTGDHVAVIKEGSTTRGTMWVLGLEDTTTEQYLTDDAPDEAAYTANAVWAAQTDDNVTTGSFGAWVKNSLAPLSSLNTLSNKIGSFSGSGVETVKGAFIALMRSDGTALSAIGGTYDPATDSLQATADRTISIAAKTELISSGSVTITSPVAADGTTITVVQGDDYSNDDGRAITWTGTDADQWPDLTGATLEFTARMKGAADITAVPTVVTPTGTQVFRMELSSTDTDVTTGRYRYDVQATLDGGNVATLLNGAFVVQRTYTDAP